MLDSAMSAATRSDDMTRKVLESRSSFSWNEGSSRVHQEDTVTPSSWKGCHHLLPWKTGQGDKDHRLGSTSHRIVASSPAPIKRIVSKRDGA